MMENQKKINLKITPKAYAILMSKKSEEASNGNVITFSQIIEGLDWNFLILYYKNVTMT